MDEQTVRLDERIRAVDLGLVSPMDRNAAVEKEFLRYLGGEIFEAYKAKALPLCPPEPAEGLGIVYSPLHGMGALPVPELLRLCGHFVTLVKEQAVPDGDFPTVVTPNPERPEAFERAIAYRGAPMRS